jgi:hypothetical protein
LLDRGKQFARAEGLRHISIGPCCPRLHIVAA